MPDIIETAYHQRGYDPLYNLRHSHDECFEIIQIYSGSGSVLIGERLYPMQPDSVYFINGLETHATNPRESEKYVRNKVIVSGSFLNELCRVCGIEEIQKRLFLERGGACHRPDAALSQQMDGLFARIHSAAGQHDFAKGHVASLLLELLLMVQRFTEADEQPVSQIDTLMRHINENLYGQLDIDSLAQAVHLSKYYMCRLFKRQTNMTIMEYIIQRRISEAKKLLLYSRLSISEIALRTGFSSLSFFSRAFREREGITPSQFRGGQPAR